MSLDTPFWRTAFHVHIFACASCGERFMYRCSIQGKVIIFKQTLERLSPHNFIHQPNGSNPLHYFTYNLVFIEQNMHTCLMIFLRVLCEYRIYLLHFIVYYNAISIIQYTNLVMIMIMKHFYYLENYMYILQSGAKKLFDNVMLSFRIRCQLSIY